MNTNTNVDTGSDLYTYVMYENMKLANEQTGQKTI